MGSRPIQHRPTEMLDHRKMQAVDLLARSVPKSRVAKEVGVDRTTVYEWLKQAQFICELQKRREHLVAILDNPSPYLAGLMHWQENLPRVMQSVIQVACDPGHKNQLRAAELVLEHLQPENLDQSVSDDVRVVAEYAQAHGWQEIADDGTS